MVLQISRETPQLNEGYDVEQFNRTHVKEKSQKNKNDFLNLENPSVK
jgi:hypothetical protein